MKRDEKENRRIINHGRMTGNAVGEEGAKVMSELLKVNTTLTTLILGSFEYEMEGKIQF